MTVRRGHLVVEAAVRPATKAQAVEQLRTEFGAATVVYVGDDETDEEVFRALGPPRRSPCASGPGESAATYRLADPSEVVALLRGISADIVLAGSARPSPAGLGPAVTPAPA